jgi:hypothetical protein
MPYNARQRRRADRLAALSRSAAPPETSVKAAMPHHFSLSLKTKEKGTAPPSPLCCGEA